METKNLNQNGTQDEFVPVEFFNDGMYLEDDFYDDFDDEDYFDDYDDDDDNDYDDEDFNEDYDLLDLSDEFGEDASPERLFGRRRRKKGKRNSSRGKRGRSRGPRRSFSLRGNTSRKRPNNNRSSALKTKVNSIDRKVKKLTSANRKLTIGFDKIAKNQVKLNSKIGSINKSLESAKMMEMIRAFSGPNITSMNITDGTTTKEIKVNSTKADTTAALLPLMLNGGFGGSKGDNGINSILPFLFMGDSIDPIMLMAFSNLKQ